MGLNSVAGSGVLFCATFADVGDHADNLGLLSASDGYSPNRILSRP